MELSSEVLETQEVGIQTTTAYLVATRLGNDSLAHASKQRTDHHHRAAQVGTLFHKLVAFQIAHVQRISLERERTLSDFLDLDINVAQQLNEVVDVADVGDVVDGHLVASEQRGTDNL